MTTTASDATRTDSARERLPRSPGVLVTWRTPGLISGLAWDLAGRWMVHWTSARGWHCTCPGPAEGEVCVHVARIRRLTMAGGR